MKKINTFLIAISLILLTNTFGYNKSENIIIKEKYDEQIVGYWYGKTFKTIFNFPVIIKVNFKKNALFHLNIKVLGFDYDNVYGNYKFKDGKKLLILSGWRKRTEKVKILKFRIIQFRSRHIRLSLTQDDKEIKNATTPISFFKDKNMLDQIEP